MDRVAGERFDLLVIGAGILGASTALAAASAGARVAVVDRGDLAGATSSASSKLLHGGLRYLEMGDVAQVLRSHSERWATARVMAPQLAVSTRFLVPVVEDGPVPLWKVRSGVAAYSALARWMDGRGGRISQAEAERLVPDLAVGRTRGVVVYHDHVTHDARLTLAVLQGAAERGAHVLTHAEVVGLRTSGGMPAGADLVDRLGGASFTISATAVVNATGPWVDDVRRLESPAAGTSVRLSKGVHLLLRGAEGWNAAVTTPLSEGRVSFAVPWQGLLLLGTTDDEFAGDPSSVAATDRDAARILDEAAVALRPEALDPNLVASRLAGLRVLPMSAGGTSRIRRGTVVTRGPGGMISVAGGKLTMWRTIGRNAARLALHGSGAGARVDLPVRPLPGAAPAVVVERAIGRRHPGLSADVIANLARNYGTSALELLSQSDTEGVRRIHADGPDIWAQVRHAVNNEWAATVDDVLLRRTTVGHRGHADHGIRERVAAAISSPGRAP
jgi:glycerol-3-phosphate dehydrogenase